MECPKTDQIASIAQVIVVAVVVLTTIWDLTIDSNERRILARLFSLIMSNRTE